MSFHQLQQARKQNIDDLGFFPDEFMNVIGKIDKDHGAGFAVTVAYNDVIACYYKAIELWSCVDEIVDMHLAQIQLTEEIVATLVPPQEG